MKKIIILLFLLFPFFVNSQLTKVREQNLEASWDQGIPFLSEDPYISGLTNQLEFDSLLINNKHTDKKTVKLCREIGIAFYNRGMYDAADWYLSRVKDYVEVIPLDPESVIQLVEEKPEEKKEISKELSESLESDKNFLKNLPKSYENLSPEEMEKIAKEIDGKIKKLIEEKEILIEKGESEEIIGEKENTIKSLKKEKEVIDLSLDKNKLKREKKILGIEKNELKKYLIWSLIFIGSLILIVLVLLQRKTIKVKDKEIDKQLDDINSKNTYLEHAARIIRHDMHSGINTYIPRGIVSLEKRLSEEIIKDLKIESPLKMIKEGLYHTQKVYKSVYEFTNLVKRNSKLDTEIKNIKNTLEEYFQKTSYGNQVRINDLGDFKINPILFCNALDNLVKNGLKYNRSENKKINIFREDSFIYIQDNGIGMSKEEFEKKIKNKRENEEEEEGLGINIALAILREHGFSLDCEKNEIGTKIKIKIK